MYCISPLLWVCPVQGTPEHMIADGAFLGVPTLLLWYKVMWISLLWARRQILEATTLMTQFTTGTSITAVVKAVASWHKLFFSAMNKASKI